MRCDVGSAKEVCDPISNGDTNAVNGWGLTMAVARWERFTVYHSVAGAKSRFVHSSAHGQRSSTIPAGIDD